MCFVAAAARKAWGDRSIHLYRTEGRREKDQQQADRGVQFPVQETDEGLQWGQELPEIPGEADALQRQGLRLRASEKGVPSKKNDRQEKEEVQEGKRGSD